MISANYVDGLELRIKELTAERNELAAQVEALKTAYKNICGAVSNMDDCEADSEEMTEAISDLFVLMQDGWSLVNAPAHQCLQEIRAEAGRAAIYALFEAGNCPQYENGAGDGFIECGDALKFADEYAAKVRKGGER